MSALTKVFAPHLGREVVLGGRKKNPHHRCFKLGAYLKKCLVDPPAAVDYSPKAAACIADIMKNDTLGCCVIAASEHAVGVLTGNATGTPLIASDDQVVADYSAIGGYVPGNEATDQGCDIATALQYYETHGFFDGTKLLGHLGVDPANAVELRTAVFLFENTWVGFDMPAAWVSPMPGASGFVWDVAGDPVDGNGHCVQVVGYNAVGILIATWGLIGTVTWAAVAKYCAVTAGGDLYVGVSPDQLAKGQTLAPNGVSWNDLVADFDSLGGAVAMPEAAAIVPVTCPMTLALAQQAAAAGLNQANALLTKAQAIQFAAKGLAAAWPTS